MSKTYTAEELAEILGKHGKWLRSETGGKRANLSGADLRGAGLSGANLRGANLSGAYLRGAGLSGANLREADLSGACLHEADLSGAGLSGADLSGACLHEADLREADLSGANLRGAYLRGADLRGAGLSGADLRGANLSYWIIPEEGEFIAWKSARASLGVVVLKLRIPAEAARACCYTSRKCRVDRAIPVAAYYKDGSECKGLDFVSLRESWFKYQLNVESRPDSFNADPREECTNGIHIFITRKEAEDWT